MEAQDLFLSARDTRSPLAACVLRFPQGQKKQTQMSQQMTKVQQLRSFLIEELYQTGGQRIIPLDMTPCPEGLHQDFNRTSPSSQVISTQTALWKRC